MNIIKKCILIIALLVLGILVCINNLENGILFSILSFAFIFIFVKNVKIKRFSIFLILFSLIIKIAGVLILKVPINVDYQVMYDASLSALNGNLSFAKDTYFATYGYQLGHVFYQTFALKIVNSIVFLKILNCIYSTVITWLIYMILKKFTKENTARITSLLYCISLYPIYLNSVLGNQQLCLMLFLIGIYILLTKKSTIANCIIIGLLFALGNLERPEGIIYITTLIIYNIITLKNVKLIIKNTASVIIPYLIVTQLFSFILIKSNVNEIGFKNSDPYWKFLLGFNYEYNGKNNLDDYKYAVDVNLEKQEIINRISNVKRIPNLFYNKAKILWLYDDLDTTFTATTTTQFSQRIVKIVVNYIVAINMFILALAFIGLIKNKNVNNAQYFCIINILIYFAVYLLIEVSARYYFNPQIGVIILSAFGIDRSINFIKGLQLYLKEKKNNVEDSTKSEDEKVACVK